jgi:phosphoribosylamine--glycine ligase
MKVLVVGSGAREHAIAWAVARSRRVEKLFCAPGNAGMAQQAECIPIEAGDLAGLADFASSRSIDLTVVGPEAPLAEGIVDEFRRRSLGIFGPDKAAARIESSKVFAKELMVKYGIPTGKFEVFGDAERAERYVKETEPPVVVKADGLAAGKGVVVARTRDEALAAVRDATVTRAFGEAGSRVVIEEYLEGQEVTLKVFADGEAFLPMEPAQDYKPALDGDRGPNTGGMGCYSPVPLLDEELESQALERIVKPALRAMVKEGCPYSGVLYAGLILTGEGLKVLEFNGRFGDPEAQVILPRMETDLVDILEAVVQGRLETASVKWSGQKCVCVVMASGGYPGKYRTGAPIEGLEEAGKLPGVIVFHAGTRARDGAVVTSGGRVLGVSATGGDFAQAVARAYEGVGRIHFEGAQYRSDIGRRAMSQEAL